MLKLFSNEVTGKSLGFGVRYSQIHIPALPLMSWESLNESSEILSLLVLIDKMELKLLALSEN